jgi:hypothetical protein
MSVDEILNGTFVSELDNEISDNLVNENCYTLIQLLNGFGLYETARTVKPLLERSFDLAEKNMVAATYKDTVE